MKFSEVCGYTSTVLFSIMLVPQVHKTLKTKSAKDLSLWFLIMFFVGSILRGYYSYTISATPIIINNIIVAFIMIWLMVLYHMYKK